MRASFGCSRTLRCFVEGLSRFFPPGGAPLPLAFVKKEINQSRETSNESSLTVGLRQSTSFFFTWAKPGPLRAQESSLTRYFFSPWARISTLPPSAFLTHPVNLNSCANLFVW